MAALNYSALKDSEDTIRQMLEGVTQLTETLVLISSRLDDTSNTHIGPETRQRVGESVLAQRNRTIRDRTLCIARQLTIKPHIIDKLLSSGAEASLTTLDGYNGTPLYPAVESGQVDAVQALLELGSDVNVLNSYGQTVLHRAAEGHLNVTRVQLDHVRKTSGEDELRRLVGVKDWYGWTLMYRAADLGNTEVVKLLSVARRSQKQPK